MANAKHFFRLKRRVNTGINIAFPVTMETQQFGPSSFLESFLILLFALTPCCEFSYQKVSSPCCHNYADQVAFLICLLDGRENPLSVFFSYSQM